MSKVGNIWFRKATSSFYCKVDGKQVKLATHEEGEEKARLEHAKLVISNGEQEKLTKEQPIKDLLGVYLDYVSVKFSPEHQRTVNSYIRDFVLALGDKVTADVKAYMLDDLIALRTHWSNNTRRRYRITIVAAFNWLLFRELIVKNPFAASKNYPIEYRGSEAVLSIEALQTLVDNSPSWLRDILIVLSETGCRPATLCRLEAAEIDWEGNCWTCLRHKTLNKTNKPLAVPMTKRVKEICRQAATHRPQGTIFRNASGKPITTQAIYLAMNIVAKKHNLGAVYPYMLRHTLAHRALMSWNMTPQEVAAVLGHTSFAMVSQCYGHHTNGVGRLAAKIDQGLLADTGSE